MSNYEQLATMPMGGEQLEVSRAGTSCQGSPDQMYVKLDDDLLDTASDTAGGRCALHDQTLDLSLTEVTLSWLSLCQRALCQW